MVVAVSKVGRVVRTTPVVYVLRLLCVFELPTCSCFVYCCFFCIIVYCVLGSPSECGWLQIPEVSRVAKGGNHQTLYVYDEIGSTMCG